MSNSDEVYRGVVKFIDYTTGQEYFERTKPYARKSSATMGATRISHPHGKDRKARVIVNNTKPGYHYNDPNKTFFEFVEKWVERADMWVRV